MAEEETNKWSRKRGFFSLHGGDLLMLVTSIFFLGITLFLVAFVLIRPKVPGLSEVFSDPPPPPRPQIEQKLNLAPGEQEILLFDNNKPRPVPGAQQPQPQQKR